MSMDGHYVYRCYSVEGELIYVGQTMWTEARFRVDQHVASTPWWAEVVDVKVTRQCCRGCAIDAERRSILQHRPCHNRQVLQPGGWATRCDNPVPNDVHWGIPEKCLEHGHSVSFLIAPLGISSVLSGAVHLRIHSELAR